MRYNRTLTFGKMDRCAALLESLFISLNIGSYCTLRYSGLQAIPGHHTYAYNKPCKWVLLSFLGCFRNAIAIVVVIAFIAIVIDYNVICLFVIVIVHVTRNRNQIRLLCNHSMSASSKDPKFFFSQQTNLKFQK